MTDGTPDFDTNRTFVQVVERRPDGFVEFRFSIGDPSLYVEMLLTESAYLEFAALQHAEVLEPLPAADAEHEAEQDATRDDSADFGWSLHDATHRRFKEHPDPMRST